MNQSNPFTPIIVWGQDLNNPERSPVEIDVQDGRAEYMLSGPYLLAEGGKIEIVGGKVLWSGRRVTF